MTDLHHVVSDIESLLEAHGVWYKRFEHEAVRTSEEASAVRPEYSIAQGTKALIVRVKKDGNRSFAMIVVPGDKRFNERKTKEILEAKDIRFANIDEVKELTDGVEPGGVPPLGNLFNVSVYVDQRVFLNEDIIFNAGDKRVSIAMKSSDYADIVNPSVHDLARDN